MKGFFLLILTVVVYGSSTKYRRLLLHSETDMVTELLKLQQMVTDLQKHSGTVYVRWGKDSCPQNNETTMIYKDSGTVYVRWGKDSCPQNNETTMIYKGYMGGKYYNDKGSGANSLCLPADPTWGKYQDGSQHNRAYIWGAEFEEPDTVIFGKNVMNEDIPCVVCKVPRVTVMIPARVDCYPGWTLEYTGYLMTAHNSHSAFDYICVDANPEFVTRGASNTDGHLPYLVEGRCGTLVCPPYYDYRELACSVCSF